MGVRCNPYGYLWFLQIQSYNHSTLYIRTVVSLQWHQLCFVNTKVNYLWPNKLCFVCLLYMGVLQQDPIPKLCFAMVLTICKDFFGQIVRIFCHDLTDRSCPRLTPLILPKIKWISVPFSKIFSTEVALYRPSKFLMIESRRHILPAIDTDKSASLQHRFTAAFKHILHAH